jgi:hypothetical protein
MNKHYYRYMGYSDGSGIPYGLIIKCYTEEQAEQFRINGGYVLERILESIKK